jgi:hypothetical protein
MVAVCAFCMGVDYSTAGTRISGLDGSEKCLSRNMGSGRPEHLLL